MIDKEKVRELALLLIGRDTWSVESKSRIITEWLEQNQPTPVVVGLSDDQVWELAKKILVADAEVICATIGTYGEAINEYLKTQTFTQPEQFKPDWSKLDEDSTIDGCRIDLVWTCCGGLIDRETIATYERPKPTPIVEVGQVWRYKDNDYIVESVGKVKFGDGWIDCVTYSDETVSDTKPFTYYTRTLSDFLVKFERVS